MRLDAGARAHAKSGDAATISGYPGKGDTVDRALSAFALACVDRAQKDHAALAKAMRAGRVKAWQKNRQTASCASPELCSIVRRPEGG